MGSSHSVLDSLQIIPTVLIRGNLGNMRWHHCPSLTSNHFLIFTLQSALSVATISLMQKANKCHN